MMEIFLLRHGMAGRTRPGGSDADRELTEEGIEAVGRVATRARAAHVVPSLILSSTYARAAETAAIAARVLGYQGRIERTAALLPDASPFDAWEEIRAWASDGQVLVVAHEPLLSSLAAFLLGVSALEVQMVAAAMVAISLEHAAIEPQGVLRWMITPLTA